MTSKNFRIIGQVTKPHGLRGDVTVRIESDFPAFLLSRERLWRETPRGHEPLAVTRAREHKGQLVFAFEEVPGRNEAEELRGEYLYLPEEEAAEAFADDEDFFYNSDLMGLRVIDADSGTELGKVAGVLETPGSNLLDVRGLQAFMLPFHRDLIASVDLEQGRLLVRPPEGLIELNQRKPGSEKGQAKGPTRRGKRAVGDGAGEPKADADGAE